jgi:hypothetical protein
VREFSPFTMPISPTSKGITRSPSRIDETTNLLGNPIYEEVGSILEEGGYGSVAGASGGKTGGGKKREIPAGVMAKVLSAHQYQSESQGQE